MWEAGECVGWGDEEEMGALKWKRWVCEKGAGLETDGARPKMHGIWGKASRLPEGLEAGDLGQEEVKLGLGSQGQGVLSARLCLEFGSGARMGRV